MELFNVSTFLMSFDIQEIIMFNFQPLAFEVPECHSIKDENPTNLPYLAKIKLRIPFRNHPGGQSSVDLRQIANDKS